MRRREFLIRSGAVGAGLVGGARGAGAQSAGCQPGGARQASRAGGGEAADPRPYDARLAAAAKDRFLPGDDLGAPVPPAEPDPSPVEVLDALWQALKDHYPMLEYIGVRGDEWRDEFRPRVAAAPDLAAAYPILEELVCRLRDYHTRLIWPGKPELISLPVRGHVLRRPARVTLIVRESAAAGVSAGDEIVAVDGRPAAEALDTAARFAVGSTPEAQARSAAHHLLSAPRGATRLLTLKTRANSAAREVRLAATGFPDNEPTVLHRAIDGATGYVRIPRWDGRPGEDLAEMFDAALDAYRGHPALLIDVRGNGGGSDGLADQVTGRFIARPVVSSVSFHRQPPSEMFKKTVEWCGPRGPWQYPGRVAVLADEGCASACEHFVSGMLAAGACLIGMPTSGACGWTRRIELPGGAILQCSRTFPLHGATPSPRHGLEPHFRVSLTRRDVRAGRDAALTRALEWLRSEAGLPVRREPIY